MGFSLYFRLDLLGTQNVYAIDKSDSKSKSNILTPMVKWPILSPGRTTPSSTTTSITEEFENVVFQFSKTPCSTDFDSKKCMGSAKGDQFNSKYASILKCHLNIHISLYEKIVWYAGSVGEERF